MARSDPRFEIIKTATFGIVFLGTPHRGSDATSMGQLVARLAKVAFYRPQTMLLDTLKRDSNELDTLSHQFSHMHASLKIVSCFEQKETWIRKGPRGIFRLRLMVGAHN